MGRQARTEAASGGEGSRGRARCREGACLEDAAELLGIALSPPPGQRGIVIEENIWAVIDRLPRELGFHQDERLAVQASVAKVMNATRQRCRVHFMRTMLAHAGCSGVYCALCEFHGSCRHVPVPR